jgi:phage regulator Rha-like protein
MPVQNLHRFVQTVLAMPAASESRAKKSPLVRRKHSGQFHKSSPIMTQLIDLGNSQKTMSSREIAELIEKQHSHIKISAERLAEKGVIGTLVARGFTHNGNEYTEYLLNKRDSLILVAQNCPEFTARIIDRWQQLEAQAAKPPAELSRMDILRLAMESEEARIKAEAERDEAIRTKHLIGSKREATAMATASKAKAESQKLKAELGFCAHHATIKAVQQATGTEHAWQPMREWCASNNVPPNFVPDPLYGKVRAWPAQAWRACHAVDLFVLFGQEVAA